MTVTSYGSSLSGGGVAISATVARTSDGVDGRDPSIPAGKSGTLSTRTDNDTGVCTVSSGHGYLDTDTVDLYWDGGRRYNVDVTAVGATTISIDAGAGDNLRDNDKQSSISTRKLILEDGIVCPPDLA